MAEYFQFIDGIASLGLWQIFKENRTTMVPLLVYSDNYLCTNELKSLWIVKWNSNEGRKQKEEDVIFC